MGRARVSGNADVSAVRRQVIAGLVPVYLAVMIGMPGASVVLAFLAAPAGIWRLAVVVAAPAMAGAVYVLTCCLLCLPTRRFIVEGRYPRDLGHAIYGPRRLYALCWTAIYYCGPVYHAILAVPLARRLVFRFFGYRGSLEMQLYPDTWLRDLPILDISPTAYLSNKATIGTNMCMPDGTIIVRGVRIERGAMVGHLVMLGPGAVIRENADIGVGSGIGLGTEIGPGARIGPCCVVSHGARIGAGVELGIHSLVGAKAVIAAGLRIPGGTVIPPRARVRNREDLERFLSPVGTRMSAFTWNNGVATERAG
jgi:carbonic anhydrase/acetyltransferase-like protein (isoleucine patch superfamily)